MKRLFSVILLLSLFSFSCNNSQTKGTSEEIELKPTEEPAHEVKYAIAKVSTRLGDMYFWLFDETPNHKAKFIELANDHHYDQFTFNRIVKDFVVQGGCPDEVTYFEDSPYLINPEFVDSLRHVYGALGMGRDNNPEKQSNACQFYIVCKEDGVARLDGDYMIFGKIIQGKDVLESIEAEKTNTSDEPLTDIPLVVTIEEYTEEEIFELFDVKL